MSSIADTVVKDETLADVVALQQELDRLHIKGELAYQKHSEMMRRVRTLHLVAKAENTLAAFALVQIGLDQLRSNLTDSEHDKNCPVRQAMTVGPDNKPVLPWQQTTELTWQKVLMQAVVRSPMAGALVAIVWMVLNKFDFTKVFTP